MSLYLIEHKQVLVQVMSFIPSVGRSVSVNLSGILWKNGSFNLDAVWGGRSAGSKDEASRWIAPWQGSILGVNVGHPIATNRDFVALLC